MTDTIRLTVDESALSEALDRIIKAADQAQKRYYDYDEASVYMRISRSSLERLVYLEDITHIKVGSRVVFDRADLDSYLESRKVHCGKEGAHA